MATLTITGQIATTAAVSDAAKELLRDDLSPVAYLDLLAGKALFKDALQFFAHSVPTDVTVQWAVDCVKEFKPKAENPPKRVDTLPLCEQWLKTRSETDRWEAGKTAQKGGISSPADCVAMAVFFAGKSITAPEAPPTPPPPYASQKMAAGAVRIAVVQFAPEKAAQNYLRALAMGKKLAQGKGIAYFANA